MSINLHRWDIGHDFKGFQSFGFRLGHVLTSDTHPLTTGEFIYVSNGGPGGNGVIRWRNSAGDQTIFPSSPDLVENTTPVRGANGELKLYLPNGRLWVGNASGEAVALTKTSIPISGFGAALADVEFGWANNERRLRFVADPVDPTDAVNRRYAETLAATGLKLKDSARVATTGNIATLSGLLVVDGVQLVADNRVVVRAQTTQSQNGIYLAKAGAWVRAADMPAGGNWNDDVVGAYVPIDEGDQYGGTGWKVVSGTGGTIGTTAMEWKMFIPVTRETAGNGMVKVGTALHFAQSASYTTGSIFFASGPTALSQLAPGTAGRPLLSGASGPSYGQLALGGGHVSGQLPVANGGTGGSSASAARTNLGLVIGTDVQAFSSNLSQVAGLSTNGYAVRAGGNWSIQSGVPSADLTGFIPATRMPAYVNGDAVSTQGTIKMTVARVTGAALSNGANNTVFDLTGADNGWSYLLSVHTASGSNFPESLANGSGLHVQRNEAASVSTAQGSWQLWKGVNDSERLYFRARFASNWAAFRRVWHEGDQGAGSGMDADTVDGLHANQLALASHTHNASDISAGRLALARMPTSGTANRFLKVGTANSDPTYAEVTKSDVGLGNVENTALSTWTGSGIITTIGTLTAGTVPWARLSNVPSSFTPSAHSHAAADVTSGTFTHQRGGTGFNSYTVGQILVGAGGGGLTLIDPGQANRIFVSNGTSSVPSWQELDLAGSIPTGILPLNKGGTNKTSWVSGSVAFAGASGLLEDSANLFWNNSTKRLGVGVNTPQDALDVNGTAQVRNVLKLTRANGNVPMEVTSRTRVPNLNVDQLDGADVGNLAPAGGVAFTNRSDQQIRSELPENLGATNFSVWVRVKMPTTAPSSGNFDVFWTVTQSDSTAIAGNAFLRLNDAGAIVYRQHDSTSLDNFRDATVSNAVSLYGGRVIDVVVTRAGNVVKIHIDGVEQTTTETTGGTGADFGQAINQKYFFLGRQSTSRLWRGAFHRAVLFNRALSAAEAASLTVNGVDPADQWGTQGSLLTNGDFEGAFSSGVAASWAVNGAPVATEENVIVNSGSKSQKIVASSNFAGIYQQLSGPGVAGKRYRLTAFLRVETGSVFLHFRGSVNDAAVVGTNVGPTSGQFQKFTVEGVLPTQGNNNNVTAWALRSSDMETTWYLDDVSLERIGAVIDLDLGRGYGTTFPDRSSNNLTGVGSGDLVHLLPIRGMVMSFKADTLGAGSAATFDVVHNLGTVSVVPSVVHKSTGEHRGVGIKTIDANTIRVEFGESKTGSDYRVTVLAI